MATIDLRPMSLGEVLDKTFTLYREHFLLFVGITALPYLILLIFKFGMLLLTSSGKVLSPTTPASEFQSAALIGGAVIGALIGGILMLLLIGVAHAATVCAVSEIYLGRTISVRESYRRSKGKALTVIGILIMSGLATLVGILLLIIPGIYLACRLAVSVPAAIIEDESPVASMERSMELTRGFAMQVFLLLLLVTVLTYVVTMLLQLPVVFFAITAAAAKHQVSAGVTAYSYVAEFLGQVFVGPVGLISASLMYYNLRVRKEGFDIQHLMTSLGNAPVPESRPI